MAPRRGIGHQDGLAETCNGEGAKSRKDDGRERLEKHARKAPKKRQREKEKMEITEMWEGDDKRQKREVGKRLGHC